MQWNLMLVHSTYRVGSDICANTGLIKRERRDIASIEHAVKLENVAIRMSTAEFVPRALEEVSRFRTL